jgi:cadmium resistance protein CadD (predicted permease)
MATLATATAMFASTNIDNGVALIVLTIASHATGVPRRWQIWVGQYLGTVLIVVMSALGALGLSVVPVKWAGLLGVVPLSLGILLLVKARRHHRPSPPVATGVWSVAGVAVANGGDNISVYTPAFRIMGLGNVTLTVTVFAVLTAALLLAGMLLISQHRMVEVLRYRSGWIVPFGYIVLGVYIVDRSGLLLGRFLI